MLRGLSFVDPIKKKIEIYYLQTGKYILQDSYAMEDIEKSSDYNTERKEMETMEERLFKIFKVE